MEDMALFMTRPPGEKDNIIILAGRMEGRSIMLAEGLAVSINKVSGGNPFPQKIWLIG